MVFINVKHENKNFLNFEVLTQSSFPDEWKMARVTPIFKNGQRNLPETTDQFQFYLSLAKLWKEFYMINFIIT